MNPRPFAARARELCTEDHSKVWFCPTCRMIESRLTPIGEVVRDMLADVDPPLVVTYTRDPLAAVAQPPCDCSSPHRWDCSLTPIWRGLVAEFEATQLPISPWPVEYTESPGRAYTLDSLMVVHCGFCRRMHPLGSCRIYEPFNRDPESKR